MANKYPTSHKKTLAKVLILLAIAIFTLVILFQMEDIGDIWSVLQQTNFTFIGVALLLLLLYILLYPVTLHILAKVSREKTRFKDNFMISSIEYFFNGITPFATGGQPFQVIAYNKIGVPPSRSTGLILLNYVVYQMSICILCLLSLFYYNHLSSIPSINVMLIVGFLINFIVLAVFIMLGVSKTVRNLMTKLVDKILSLKVFRGKFEKSKVSFRQYCADAQFVFKEILKKSWAFLSCVVLKVLSLCIYFAIPLFILKALGVTIGIDSWFFIVCMTTFSVAMTCFIPTPGSSGGIEFAFVAIFATIPGVTSIVSASGVLLWRFITYYCLMLFSFTTYLVFEAKVKKRRKRLGLDIAPVLTDSPIDTPIDTPVLTENLTSTNNLTENPTPTLTENRKTDDATTLELTAENPSTNEKEAIEQEEKDGEK